MRSEICRYVANRPIPITPRRLATSQFSGEWPSPYSGKGMDFKSHRPFELGDDLRSINMPMSIRAGKRMVVDRIAMRDISIYILLDCSASMGIRNKAAVLNAVTLMLLYSGASLEMRVGVSIINDQGHFNMGLGMGNRHTIRLMDAVENICECLHENKLPDYEFRTYGLQRQLPSGCILFYISDFLDSHGRPAVDFPFLLNFRKFDLIPVVIQDEFEYSFPDLAGDSLIELSDPETGEHYPLWFGKQETDKLKKIHEKRFSELNNSLIDRGLNYIHVELPQIQSIHQLLSHYFLYR